MTGAQFETQMCLVFSGLGFWAHKLARDERGAQPFDVIAIKQTKVFAVDCKVCGTPRFSLSRAEANQMLAFSMLSQKSGYVNCGFMCYHNGDIYFIPYDTVKYCEMPSIPLVSDFLWMGREDVKRLIGEGIA